MKLSSDCFVVLLFAAAASITVAQSQTQSTPKNLPPAPPKKIVFSTYVNDNGYVMVDSTVRGPNDVFFLAGAEDLDSTGFYSSSTGAFVTYISPFNISNITALAVLQSSQAVAAGSGIRFDQGTGIPSCTPIGGLMVTWIDAGTYLTCVPGIPDGAILSVIAVDASNSVYVASGSRVTKINATPASIYAINLGGSATNITGIVAGSFGELYVTGNAGKDLPTVNALQPTGNGAFLAKIDPTGNVVFATYLNGKIGGTAANAIAYDGISVYVTGWFPGTGLTTFVSKVAKSGQQVIYRTAIGRGIPAAIAVDAKGQSYVTGQASSTFPLVRAFQTTPASGFVASLSSNGSTILWSSFLGGSGVDHMRGIAVNSDGTVWVGGDTESTDFPVTNGSACFDFGCESGFMTKISAN